MLAIPSACSRESRQPPTDGVTFRDELVTPVAQWIGNALKIQLASYIQHPNAGLTSGETRASMRLEGEVTKMANQNPGPLCPHTTRALKSAARIRGREHRHGSLSHKVRIFHGLPLPVPG